MHLIRIRRAADATNDILAMEIEVLLSWNLSDACGRSPVVGEKSQIG